MFSRLSHSASRLSQRVASLAALPARSTSSGASSAPRRFPGPITHNQHTTHLSAGVGQLTPLIAERAQGSYIYDAAGNKYIDLCCGIAVTNLGHCHPKVTHKPQAQAAAAD